MATATLLFFDPLGCQAQVPEGDATRSARAGIIGGAPSQGDPAVVAIAAKRQLCAEPIVPFCSGTLVAPRVVLTAAHCLGDQGRSAQLEVFFGDDVQGPGAAVLVQEQRQHPGYNPETNENDAALLLLARPVDVLPVELPASGAVLEAGMTVRAVGFGVTDRESSEPGVKRSGEMRTATVSPGSFECEPAPAMTCAGDSGGPVLLELDGGERIVGVTSKGDFLCEQLAFNIRVDSVLQDFVLPFLEEAKATDVVEPPAGPGEVRCSGTGECPAMLTCDAASGQCILPALGPGTLGTSCSAERSCPPGGSCVRIWEDDCRCYQAESAPEPPGPDAPVRDTEVAELGGGGCAVGRRGSGWGWLLAACVVLRCRGKRLGSLRT